MANLLRDQVKVELAVLRMYGLRYSILAAWEEELRVKGIKVVPSIAKPLEAVRVKISSGCFSVCDVGSDLGRIEGILVSTATTSGRTNVDEWLGFLGESMSETANVDEIEKRINLPAVKMHYNRFNFGGPCGKHEI
jgi:hypothetical protein